VLDIAGMMDWKTVYDVLQANTRDDARLVAKQSERDGVEVRGAAARF
jgi:hypothetical protein